MRGGDRGAPSCGSPSSGGGGGLLWVETGQGRGRENPMVTLIGRDRVGRV